MDVLQIYFLYQKHDGMMKLLFFIFCFVFWWLVHIDENFFKKIIHFTNGFKSCLKVKKKTKNNLDFQSMFCRFIFCTKNTMEWWNFYFLTFFLFFDDLYILIKILIVWIYNAILTNFFEVGSKASNVGGSLSKRKVFNLHRQESY